LKSRPLSSNLSGTKSSGASHSAGSRPIAHAFTSTIVPRAAALPRKQQWPRRVQPQRLLYDQPQVSQIDQAVLRHLVVAGECSPDLILRLPHHRRVPHQLGHCPLQRRRRRLAAGSKHVLCVRWCVVETE
jgi:hypothetical protein